VVWANVFLHKILYNVQKIHHVMDVAVARCAVVHGLNVVHNLLFYATSTKAKTYSRHARGVLL
jgi:hypothetical protein